MAVPNAGATALTAHSPQKLGISTRRGNLARSQSAADQLRNRRTRLHHLHGRPQSVILWPPRASSPAPRPMINHYDIAYSLGLGISAPVWLSLPKARRKVLTALRDRMGDVQPRTPS